VGLWRRMLRQFSIKNVHGTTVKDRHRFDAYPDPDLHRTPSFTNVGKSEIFWTVFSGQHIENLWKQHSLFVLLVEFDTDPVMPIRPDPDEDFSLEN
jgi:hypothetical protein